MICDKCGCTVAEQDKHVMGYHCSQCGYIFYSAYRYMSSLKSPDEFDDEVRFILDNVYEISKDKKKFSLGMRANILSDLYDLFKDYYTWDYYLRSAALRVLSALEQRVPYDTCDTGSYSVSYDDYVAFMQYFDKVEFNLAKIKSFINLCFYRDIETYNFEETHYRLSEPELYMLSWYCNAIEDNGLYEDIDYEASKKRSKHRRIGVLTGVALAVAFCLFVISAIIVMVQARENLSIMPVSYLLFTLAILDAIVAVIALDFISRKYRNAKNYIYDILSFPAED